MINVTVIRSFTYNGAGLVPGSTHDLPDQFALEVIGRGDARYTTAPAATLQPMPSISITSSQVSDRGQANGVATLGGDGKVPAGQLPDGGGSFPTINDSLGRAVLSPRYNGTGRTNLRLRKALRDLAGGTRQSLRILAIGDSLATGNWPTVNAQIETVLSGHLSSATWYGRMGTTTGAITGEMNGSSTATRVEKTDYAYSWLGITVRHASGTPRSIWGLGNSAPNADRIIIPVYRESGAGAIRVEIAPGDNGAIPAAGSGLWRDPLVGEVTVGPALTGGQLIYDAAHTSTALYCIVLTVAFGRWAVRITHNSGDTVRTMDPMFEVAGSPAVNSYRMAAGSNTFTATNSAANPHMAEFIRVYNPDLIVIESDDSTAAYEAFLPQLDAAITASTLTSPPLVVLVGNPGIGTGFGTTQADLAVRINYCWEYALPRRWDVIDGLAMAQGISTLTEVGWNADNVHLNNDIWREMARMWAFARGYMRVVERRPGGDLASLTDLIVPSSQRYIPAQELVAILGSPNMMDTGWMTWGFALGGSGVGSKSGTFLVLDTTTGANSTVAAYPDNLSVSIGWNNGGIRFDKRLSFSGLLRIQNAMTTNAQAYLLLVERTYNAAYAGALTTEGCGFRITTGGVIYGTARDSGSTVLSPNFATLTEGGSSNWHTWQCILTPATVNASRGTVEWFVDGVSLGTRNYAHTNNIGRMRLEITSGADTGRSEIRVTPPKLVTLK